MKAAPVTVAAFGLAAFADVFEAKSHHEEMPTRNFHGQIDTVVVVVVVVAAADVIPANGDFGPTVGSILVAVVAAAFVGPVALEAPEAAGSCSCTLIQIKVDAAVLPSVDGGVLYPVVLRVGDEFVVLQNQGQQHIGDQTDEI